jgi:hypothetical protein
MQLHYVRPYVQRQKHSLLNSNSSSTPVPVCLEVLPLLSSTAEALAADTDATCDARRTSFVPTT